MFHMQFMLNESFNENDQVALHYTIKSLMAS